MDGKKKKKKKTTKKVKSYICSWMNSEGGEKPQKVAPQLHIIQRQGKLKKDKSNKRDIDWFKSK